MKVLLFSGGIDSTAIAWEHRPDRLFFVDYGQRAARGEFRAVSAIASELKLPLDVRSSDLSSFGHGTMVGGISLNPAAPEFWPYRNQMLITLAAMVYAGQSVEALMLGSVSGDEVHPDGTAEFRKAMNALLSAQSSIRLEAPACHMKSEELVRKSGAPLALLGWTFSCHTGEWACGSCRGCTKHEQIMGTVFPNGVHEIGK